MGKWANNAKFVDEKAAITFHSWDELHGWLETCAPKDNVCRMDVCPLIEELFVIGCYQVYRSEELNEVTSNVYTDGYAGKDFTIVGEIPPGDVGFDVEELPLYWCDVEGMGTVHLYPEEIFVHY